MKFKFENHLNTFNIIATLIIGIAALFISFNSYRLSERQTYLLEQQNSITSRQTTLEEGQQKLELKNSILELMNISSMLRQSEKNYPSIKNCLKSFNEIKMILESQLKNKLLFDNSQLAEKWTELLMDVNFNIKFFEPGTSPNVIIDGAYDKVKDIETKCFALFDLHNKKVDKSQ